MLTSHLVLAGTRMGSLEGTAVENTGTTERPQVEPEPVVASDGEPRVQTESSTESASPVRATLVTALVAFLGYLVLATITIGIGYLITRELRHGALGRWDADVARWFADHRTPDRTDLSVYGSAVSATLTVIVLVVVAGLFLVIRRHWRELGIVLVAMAIEGATYLTATYVITRHRPRVARLEDLIVSDSFFSGHVAAATALYGSLAVVVWSLTRQPVLRVLFAVLAIVAPLVVATSRMYRGMHFASDAIVGALVGLACIVIAVTAVHFGARAAYQGDAS